MSTKDTLSSALTKFYLVEALWAGTIYVGLSYAGVLQPGFQRGLAALAGAYLTKEVPITLGVYFYLTKVL